MSPPSEPTLRITHDGRAGLPRFDEQWVAQLEWFYLDPSAESSRWTVRDPIAGRQWLVVRASQQASTWELARLDREYAMGPTLEAAWAVVPLARVRTTHGAVLVFDDDGGSPLSDLAIASLSVERFLNVAIAATKALAQAHRRGIMHCDIRPQNLILDTTGDLRLTGFAFAQVLHDIGENTLSLGDGSLAYLAPELHGRRNPVASRQSDLYALGAAFFQVLTGRLPLHAKGPVEWLHQHMAVTAPMASRWRAELPSSVDNLLARLLAKQPQMRPESAAVLEAELRSCLNECREAGRTRRSCRFDFARLPEHTRDLLAALTILGNHVPLESLAAVSGISLEQLLQRLRPALKAGLVGEYREGLSFTHDAVWALAGAQLSEQRQATLRMAYAAVLLARLGQDAESGELFRVANLLVRADVSLVDEAQRLAFVDLLMRATRQAMACAAASTALDYLAQADRLLEGTGATYTQLSASVALLAINARILNADFVTADEQIMALLATARDPLQQAKLYRLKCEICSLHGDYAAAVCTAIDGLAALGMTLTPTPTEAQLQHAWQALQDALGRRTPDAFTTLPDIQDARCQSILELLAAMVIPGSFVHPHLMLATTCQIATLALQHGLSAAAVHGIAWLGVACAHRFDDYSRGFDYADTARKLVALPRFASSKVSVLLALDQVSVWTRPLPFALECAESAYRESIAQGLPSFACYANNHIVSNLLVLGAPIERMLRQIDSGLVIARNLEFVDAQMILFAQARYIRRLAGNVAGTVAIPDSAELAQRVNLSSMGPLRFWWALYEGLLCFLDGSFDAAAGHFDAAWALSWSAPAHIHLIDLALFSVLNLAALQGASGKPQNVERPMHHLRLWARLNPRYFADRLALAEAELLYRQGRSIEALQRFDAPPLPIQ